jgi:hypothetical protein
MYHAGNRTMQDGHDTRRLADLMAVKALERGVRISSRS